MNFIRLHIFLTIFGIFLFFGTVAQENISSGNINNIPVFIYHRVGDDRFPSTNVSVEIFEKHLKYLYNKNFNIITLSDALKYLKEGRSAPEKTLVLTFDDGYSSFLENGMPLLRKYGFPATVFINSKQVGNKAYMNWDELKDLMDEGIEIANHSHSHECFVNLDIDELKEKFTKDLETSHRLFKEKLGFLPEIFSYPYGEYAPEMQQIIKNFGYKAAAGQHSGVISEYSNLFDLPRFPMTGIYARLEKFIDKANMKSLPVKLVSTKNPVVGNENPPELQVELLKPENINTRSLQCFISGSKDCKLNYDSQSKLITINSTEKLSTRRTLYTITAQSAQNPKDWYWWSWVWIIAGVNE
jgi:peptidoglycan/xylan/chitin deacetylase (PgdA/CDA1 family)